MSISIGIVGVGAFGSGFISLFRKHPLVHRVALCDVQPDRVAAQAARHGITETYGSLDEICKSDIQALVIITQPWLHAEQVVQAMKSGKHAYSAVPAAFSEDGNKMLDGCNQIIETCRRTGMLYMMGETSYYRPEAMYCRRQAALGLFGTLVHADGEYLHDVDLPGCSLRDVARSRWGSHWDSSKSGDPPMHYPTHSTGGFLSVMKAHVTELSCLGYRDVSDDWHHRDTLSGNCFGNETALLRLSNGASATIKEYRRIGAPGHEGFSLMGTQASFINNLGLSRWVDRNGAPGAPIQDEEMRDALPPEVAEAFRNERGESDYGGHGGSHAYLVHEFVESVAQGRQPAINAWEAVRYLAPGIIAHQSALRGGELMKVPDWGDAPL